MITPQQAPELKNDRKSSSADFRRDHFRWRDTVLSLVSQCFFSNNTYTIRHGLAAGMRRKGGLGFLPFDVPETAEIRFLRKLPLEGKVVYDVGAFEGILTLFFAGRARQVVSYEPNPRNYLRCAENIRLNQLTNVQLLNRGVADAAGNLELIYDPRLPAAGSGNGLIAGQIQASVREARKLSIPVIALDEDIAANRLPTPDFIKIDIEGLELAALRGLRRTIAEHRPELYVELHGALIEDKVENARAVVGLLDEYGYRIYDVENGDYVSPETLGERRPSHIYCSGAGPCPASV